MFQNLDHCLTILVARDAERGFAFLIARCDIGARFDEQCHEPCLIGRRPSRRNQPAVGVGALARMCALDNSSN